MSYNLCNLPKQITTVNGKTVKYNYFADGTKYRKSIALVQLCSSVYNEEVERSKNKGRIKYPYSGTDVVHPKFRVN